MATGGRGRCLSRAGVTCTSDMRTASGKVGVQGDQTKGNWGDKGRKKLGQTQKKVSKTVREREGGCVAQKSDR